MGPFATLRTCSAKMLRNKNCRKIDRAAQNCSRTPLKMLSLLQMRSALPCGIAAGFPSPSVEA
jgi:hypothetical protein